MACRSLQRAAWWGLVTISSFGAAVTGTPPEGPRGTLVLVRAPGAQAYREVIEGIQTAIANSETRMIETDPQGDRISGTLLSVSKPVVIIAIGPAARDALTAANVRFPVVVTMVAGRPAPGISSVVSVEVSPASVFQRLRRMFPARQRVAVIRNPDVIGLSSSEIIAEGQRSGIRVTVIDCRNPKELLDQFAALEDSYELVWCLPDGTLYQPATVTPLILSSIRRKLPIVGFSLGFVNAGALVGFFPDYRDLGAQTAEAALRILEGSPAPSMEYPRKVKAAVNERVVRVTGIRPVTDAGTDVVVLR